MASQIITDAEFIEGGDTPDPDLNQSFYDFIDQIKAEANSGGSIAVFKVPVDANGSPRPNTLNKPKLFTVPVGTMTLDDICDRVLREFVEPGQSITIQLLGRQDGKRGNRLNQMIPLIRGKSEAKSDGSTAGDIERLMRVMDERVARQMAEVRAMFEQNRAPTIDPLTQSLQITEKLTQMAVAMRTGQVAGVVAPANDPNTLMNQMMAMMMTTMMKKFMSGFDGGEKKEENNSWLKDIADLAKPLLEAKATAEKANLVNAQRMLRHEASAPVPPSAPTETSAPKQPTAQETNDMKLIAMLNEFLPMLIEKFAVAGANPVDVSKLTLDNLPEEDIGLNDALYQLIQSKPEEFLAKLATMDKRVSDHAEWFEKYRVALLADFEPDARVPQAEKAP